jgi:predicted O-methyltransferase YrrM
VIASPSTTRPHSEIFDHLYGDVVKQTLAGAERVITPIESIPRQAAEFVYETVRRIRPTTALEIGMAWGFSSVATCSALRDNGVGVNIVVDPYQLSTYEGVGLVALEQYGLAPFAQYHAERSDLFLPRFWEGRRNRVQFGFIDGDHRIDAVFVDFYYINKLLDAGGVVILDDYQFSSVKAVSEYALKNFHYEVLQCDQPRFAVLRKLKEDDRGWDAYGAF